MKLVKQNSPTTCGQACIAMLENISLEESIELVGHTLVVDIFDINDLLRLDQMNGGPPSENIIALQFHVEPNGSRAHWTISWRGKILDPACKKELWPVAVHFPCEY